MKSQDGKPHGESIRFSAPIVVVEDNDADFEVLEILLREAGVQLPILRFQTGQDAIDAIQSNNSQMTPLPLHFLLDLNLPMADGLTVLQKIRASKEFGMVPATMLTTSTNPSDVESSYRAGANGYLVKPVDFGRFSRMVKAFVQYWLGTAVLPGRSQYQSAS